MALATAHAGSHPERRPHVTSAQVPIYPLVLQVAHIEGMVELRVTTDGRGVASVAPASGQPMLAAAAVENVKTWQFEKHTPTTFTVVFRYRLLESECDSMCECDSAERPSTVLKLPTEVEIDATEAVLCDPAYTAPSYNP
jgi:TonB family protein